MSYNFKINNTDLTTYGKVTLVDIGIPERTNFTRDIPRIDGVRLDGFKDGSRPITVTLMVFGGDLESKVDSIVKAVSARKLSRIESNKKPGVYFMGILNGQIQVEPTGTTREVTVSFICPDPKAITNTKKKFTAN